MKGWKTILFNGVMLVVGLTGAAVSPEQVNEVVEGFMAIWAVGNVILRAVTDSPIFKKE